MKIVGQTVTFVLIAVCAVGVRAGEVDAAALLRKLTDPDPKVRVAATVELRKIERLQCETVEVLTKALKDEDPRVRAYAAETLAFMLWETGRLLQETQTKDGSAEVREAFDRARDRARGLPVSPAPVERPARRPPTSEEYAIQACCVFCEAQEIYRRTDWNGDGVLEYAQSLRGDNSLFERSNGKGDLQLIEMQMANAEGDPGPRTNRAGYRFRVLKGQGPDARDRPALKQEERPGRNRKSYLVDGHMTLGFALVAYPAEYGNPAQLTFIVNRDGIVYRKDLGPGTHAVVAKMTEFNPDEFWEVAFDPAKERRRVPLPPPPQQP